MAGKDTGWLEKTQQIKDYKQYAAVLVVFDGVTYLSYKNQVGLAGVSKETVSHFHYFFAKPSFFAMPSIGLPGVN